jgi:catechol 2,3-dioxygenase-like lactoylglutathione lyase family enzyme
MSEHVICGIQQMGVGVPDVTKAFTWYRKHFGMDIKVFEEAAEANLMLPYTGGKPQSRHAILAVNMNGGGGFEIWQYTSRKTEKPLFEIQFGDLGLYITKIKCREVNACFQEMKDKNLDVMCTPHRGPDGKLHFFVKDLYENIFQIVESDNWFSKQPSHTGGIFGAIIGVSNIYKSIALYQNILGFDKVVYDKTESFEDFFCLNGGKKKVRRVLLANSVKREGPFAKLLGDGQIELIEAIDYSPKKIFEGRYWGDWGFIHLCFDIRNMNALKKTCENAGYPFTVDSSNSFDMGEAAGHFTYIEDPDGALIEFVETHKVPVVKKIGWYLNLKNRNPKAYLPNWMVKAMSFNRVKD